MRTLIVGADSGIGNALLNNIPGAVGTSRRPGSDMIFLDATDDTTYPTFDEKFDTVYYCIGISGKSGDADMVMHVNAIKSIDCLRHLAKYVKDDGKIRIMSSLTGSISFGTQIHMELIELSYRMSKAALNMGVIKLHHEFPNLVWQLLHPGLVRTKMTEGIELTDTRFNFITTEESAQKILETPCAARISFVNCISGHIIPW